MTIRPLAPQAAAQTSKQPASHTVPPSRGVVRLVEPDTAAEYAARRRRASPAPGEPRPAVGAPRPGAPAQRRPARTAPAAVFSGGLEMTVDAKSRPVALTWQGLRYRVVAKPVRWFERRQWWLEEARAERGRPGLVDYEIWRVQIVPEDRPGAGVRTVDVSRQAGAGRWRVLRLHEAAA